MLCFSTTIFPKLIISFGAAFCKSIFCICPRIMSVVTGSVFTVTVEALSLTWLPLAFSSFTLLVLVTFSGPSKLAAMVLRQRACSGGTLSPTAASSSSYKLPSCSRHMAEVRRSIVAINRKYFIFASRIESRAAVLLT